MRVFDGDTANRQLLAQFSGRLSAPQRVVSTTGLMLVQLSSDASVNGEGFRAACVAHSAHLVHRHLLTLQM